MLSSCFASTFSWWVPSILAGTVFGSVSEERCAAMRSVEDLAAMGLNQSQADAVNSLVQCPYGVQLVQGPPGWKPLINIQSISLLMLEMILTMLVQAPLLGMFLMLSANAQARARRTL